MCHVIQYRVRETDEIRIVGTLSAFDWLDIAVGDTKRQIIELMIFFFFPSVPPEKGGKRQQAQIKRGSRQSCYF